MYTGGRLKQMYVEKGKVNMKSKQDLAVNKNSLAAEAVVDAAICCHEERGGTEISQALRESLIQMVLESPETTGFLFEPGSLTVQ